MDVEVDSEIRMDNDGRVGRGAVLTDRDKQLVGYLGIARYLSTKQVAALVSPGRELRHCRRRLLRLAGMWKRSNRHETSQGTNENFEPPYLRRREFRTFEGELVEVWTLSDAGYLLAESVLKRELKVPRTDVSADFLEHSVTLSELLVQMIDPAAAPCGACGRTGREWVPGRGPKPAGRRLARAELERYLLLCRGCGQSSALTAPGAEELPFRWTTTESTRLPWTEYDRKSGKTLERIIQPDGVLELDSPKRRLFLECEMGTHSIVGNENKGGATLAKSERYEKFLHGLADPKTGETFYSRQFPDAARPEVLYLVTSEGRRDAVNGALAQWRKEGHTLEARALVIAEAARLLRGEAEGRPAPALARKDARVSQSDVRELQRFYNDVIRSMKAARASARANRLPPPEYPVASDRVGQLVGRLLDAVEQSQPGGKR